MEADLQSFIAFHLTGSRTGSALESLESRDLRPALLARYRDLASLRYDFPVILRKVRPGADPIEPLSGLFDRILSALPQEADSDRLKMHALRLECAMRALAAQSGSGSLRTLGEAACKLLLAKDAAMQDSLSQLSHELAEEAEVVDCDQQMPARLLAHAWKTIQIKKAARFNERANRLILRLQDILKADHAISPAGKSAEGLKASFGTTHAEDFDFAALSSTLARTAPASALSDRRRARIEGLLAVLEGQRFYSVPSEGRNRGGGAAHAFVFESCAEALEAYRDRLPEMIALAKAVAMAEMEIEGSYRESAHDALFEQFGARGLSPKEMALFPDYLVCVNATNWSAAEMANVVEMLSIGLPVKALVQTDDILETPPIGDGYPRVSLHFRQLAGAAMNLSTVYVLQASASHLVSLCESVARGLDFEGPALFSVFSGASNTAGDLPPYLVAAGAMESRAFPAFAYDPSAGPDWASRFRVEDNAQAEGDWPLHALDYEDERLQRKTETLAFTVADFIACDRRFSRHFARVPSEKWNGSLIPVAESIAQTEEGIPEKVPSLPMVDAEGRLHRLIVEDLLVQEARRCLESWRSLQELGGIHNSHAIRALARAKAAWEERLQQEIAARAPEAAPAAETASREDLTPAAVTETAVPEPTEEKRSDDPYIETPRCTSCNECTRINSRMFVYNENKQAYIADATAGTYRELVEAAESCQISIIHPGKPRNPNEPGLEELMQRAAPFL